MSAVGKVSDNYLWSLKMIYSEEYNKYFENKKKSSDAVHKNL